MILEWLEKDSKCICVGDSGQLLEWKFGIIRFWFYRNTDTWKLTFFHPRKDFRLKPFIRYWGGIKWDSFSR